jgi:UDP-N-acetylglucosamine:LPS N-acetylglucosamine transferase
MPLKASRLRAFVPNLDRHLAACDLALVQGGLTTCMELTAAGTPVPLLPAAESFRTELHVAHRLDRYGAGRRMEFATSTPDMIAEGRGRSVAGADRIQPVEADGAVRAARMLAELL